MVIVVTGTIAPDANVGQLKIRDSGERLAQYKSGLEKLLTSGLEAGTKVVFCDNSGFGTEEFEDLKAIAGANKVEFDAELTPNNELKIIVSDNGNGLEEQFLSMPDSIFELGVTSTDGSGIGLYTIKNSLEEIGGTIKFAGNGQKMKGASFVIIIP